MKVLPLILSLIFCLIGCSQQRPIETKLAMAQNAIANDPYSVFLILDSLSPYELETRCDSALYNLYYVEALHQIGLYTENDSMIRISEKYFEDTDDKKNLILAYLHHGITYLDFDNQREAVLYLKKAEALAVKGKDKNILREIYTNLSIANMAAGINEFALRYAQRAIEISKQSHNMNHYGRDLNFLATTYYNMGKKDSFQRYIMQCIPLMDKTDAKAEILNNMGRYLLENKRRKEALSCLKKAEGIKYLPETSMLLGDLYEMEGKKALAVRYWYDALGAKTYTTNIHCYQKLIKYFREHGNTKALIDLSERLNDTYDHRSEVDVAQLTKLQSDYDEEINDQKNHHKMILLIGMIGILVLLIILFILSHKRRIRKYHHLIEKINTQYISDLRKYRNMKAELSQLRRERQQNQLLIQEKIKEITHLQEKLSEYQDDRQQPDQWNMEETLMDAEIVIHLHSLAARGKEATSTDWHELRQILHHLHPAFFTKLLSKGNINTKEMNICMLIRLRFIPSEISVLTDSSPQSITNMRVRLLSKIFHQTGGARQFDELIRSL